MTFEQKTFLIDATEAFRDWYQERQPMLLDDSDMFLQHYGLPTDLLDFTEAPRIAAYFAQKDCPGHIGRIGVLPRADAEREALELIPFRNFKIAGVPLLRPVKQLAWAIRHRTGAPSDFQDPAVCDRLGLRWYTFDKKVMDPKLFAGLEDILDATSDPCSALMRQWLANFGSVTWQSREIAAELIDRIAKYL